MRELKPCGTRAAYARHLRNGETPCDDCKAANLERVYSTPSGQKARTIDPSNLEVKAMDRLLAEHPPHITWRKNRRGIFEAVLIDDPHADTGFRSRREARSRSYANKAIETFPVMCERGHEFDSWNTIVNPDGSFECRTCATPQDSPLLAAARTEI